MAVGRKIFFPTVFLHPSHWKCMVKQLPSPGVEAAVMLPPWRCIICLQRLNPIPLPSFLVEKNGMKICSITSGGIPSPLSVTVTDTSVLPSGEDTAPELHFTSTHGDSSPLQASMAFFIKFISTCSICVRSARMITFS